MTYLFLSCLLCVLAYFFGSFNSAIVVCKATNTPDPRAQGSNNPGATNVLRLGGKKLAAVVLIIDLLKGVIPVVIAKAFGLSTFMQATIGLLAVTGHIFPIYYQFKGGKGVATSLGVFFGLSILLGLTCCLVWLAVAILANYSSAASITMVLLAPVLTIALFHGRLAYFLPLAIISLLVLIKHRSNLQRLFAGSEPKLRKPKPVNNG